MCQSVSYHIFLSPPLSAPKSKEELRQSSASADFKNSVELVQFVRRKFGNYFTVCVAGMLEGHS